MSEFAVSVQVEFAGPYGNAVVQGRSEIGPHGEASRLQLKAGDRHLSASVDSRFGLTNFEVVSMVSYCFQDEGDEKSYIDERRPVGDQQIL